MPCIVALLETYGGDHAAALDGRIHSDGLLEDETHGFFHEEVYAPFCCADDFPVVAVRGNANVERVQFFFGYEPMECLVTANLSLPVVRNVPPNFGFF